MKGFYCKIYGEDDKRFLIASDPMLIGPVAMGVVVVDFEDNGTAKCTTLEDLHSITDSKSCEPILVSKDNDCDGKIDTSCKGISEDTGKAAYESYNVGKATLAWEALPQESKVRWQSCAVGVLEHHGRAVDVLEHHIFSGSSD